MGQRSRRTERERSPILCRKLLQTTSPPVVQGEREEQHLPARVICDRRRADLKQFGDLSFRHSGPTRLWNYRETGLGQMATLSFEQASKFLQGSEHPHGVLGNTSKCLLIKHLLPPTSFNQPNDFKRNRSRFLKLVCISDMQNCMSDRQKAAEHVSGAISFLLSVGIAAALPTLRVQIAPRISRKPAR